MSNTETIATLRAARELISTPEKWTQGASARDERLISVDEGSAEAASFCVIGAVCRAVGPSITYVDSTAALREAANDPSLTLWNDRTGRTHTEVLDLFDRAIAKLEGGEHG